MAVQDWSSTAASNTTVSGINIAEGCPAGNVNNALREIMASVKVMYTNLPVTTNYVLKDGSVAFTGQPTFSGRGAFLHWGSASLTSGKMTIQATGGATPSMSEGDWLLEY